MTLVQPRVWSRPSLDLLHPGSLLAEANPCVWSALGRRDAHPCTLRWCFLIGYVAIVGLGTGFRGILTFCRELTETNERMITCFCRIQQQLQMDDFTKPCRSTTSTGQQHSYPLAHICTVNLAIYLRFPQQHSGPPKHSSSRQGHQVLSWAIFNLKGKQNWKQTHEVTGMQYTKAATVLYNSIVDTNKATPPSSPPPPPQPDCYHLPSASHPRALVGYLSWEKEGRRGETAGKYCETYLWWHVAGSSVVTPTPSRLRILAHTAVQVRQAVPIYLCDKSIQLYKSIAHEK